MELLPLASGNNLIQVGIIILIVVILWVILRTVLRLTFRIFSFGCGAIIILGLVLFGIRYFAH